MKKDTNLTWHNALPLLHIKKEVQTIGMYTIEEIFSAHK